MQPPRGTCSCSDCHKDMDCEKDNVGAQLLSVSHDDNELASFRSRPESCKRFKKLGILAAMLVIAATVAAAVGVLHQSKRPKSIWRNKDFSSFNIDLHAPTLSKTNDKPHLCGNSSTEARERGCQFHQLTWSWLPPDCSPYANRDFMNAAEEPWAFYEDVEAKVMVDDEVWEQVLDGERRVFVERREHVTHCIFMFMSLAQIVKEGTPFHQKLAEYEHMEHCANMLLGIVKEAPDWNDVDTLSGTVSFDQSCTISVGSSL